MDTLRTGPAHGPYPVVITGWTTRMQRQWRGIEVLAVLVQAYGSTTNGTRASYTNSLMK